MNILITGAGGYLGCHLTELLLQSGHHVIALDNFSEQAGTLNHLCHHPNLEIVRGDCRDAALMDRYVSIGDVIIPLAALVGVDRCKEDQTGAHGTNFMAIALMMKLLSKEQKVIFPCTNSGYGIGSDGICTEESEMKPISWYGKLKTQAEGLVMIHGNAISFRFATLFGMSPRMRFDLLVNDFVRRAVRDRSIVLFEGHFIRNFLSVRDAARVFLHAIDNWEKMKGNVFNVGLSNANLSKRQLAERVQAHVPELHIFESDHGRDLDARNYRVSNSKIEATGFMPQVSIDDGIEELKKGYLCAEH